MLIDAARYDAGSPLRADACIVGAGPAGLTLARELAARGHGVCLLESGGLSDAPSTQRLLRGRTEGDAMPPLDGLRVACFGGTSAVWTGWCRPLEPLELEERAWVPHSGWPFDAAQLEPYYRRAHEACGLGPFDYEPETWAGAGRVPLPLGASLVRTAVFQFSPPVRFGPAHRAEVAADPRITALLRATVLALEPGEGGRVAGIRVATPRGALRVESRLVVLAAGGIENARLLLLSRLGNERDLVGRYFMEHPYQNSGRLHPAAGAATGFYRQHRAGSAGGTASVRGVFTLPEALLRRERLVNCAIFLRPPGRDHPAHESAAVRSLGALVAALRRGTLPASPARQLAAILSRPDRVAVAAAHRLGLRRTPGIGLRAFVEPVPDPANRVTLTDELDGLGRPRVLVRWRVSALERRSLVRMHELLDRGLRATGLGRLELWPVEPVGVGHHMGTTRMHADPARGVVDPDGRVHGMANLYVAGSSVFPAAGLANPTLTIVALAFRMGQRLDRVLRCAGGGG